MIPFFLGVHAINKAPKLAEYKGLKKTISYLRKTYLLYRPKPVKFLISLYKYRLRLSKKNNLIQPYNFIIHFAVWGEHYTEKTIALLLPSLLAKNNAPFISQSFRPVLFIHCDSTAKRLMEHSEAYHQLLSYTDIHFEIIPKNILTLYNNNFTYPTWFPFAKKITLVNQNLKYIFLGSLQTHALEIALKHKAFISFMMPDFLLADSVLRVALEKVEGKVAVVSSMYRSPLNETIKKAENHKLNNGAISISSKDLSYFKLTHMHPYSRYQIVSEETINFFPSAQMFFKNRHGYTIRSLHYQPILVDCNKLSNTIRIDYLTIDQAFLDNALADCNDLSEKVWVCDDTSTMTILEVSADIETSQTHKTIKQSTTYDYDTLVQLTKNMIASSPTTYDRRLFRYYITVRHKIFCEDVFDEAGHIDDVKFIYDVYNDNYKPTKIC